MSTRQSAVVLYCAADEREWLYERVSTSCGRFVIQYLGTSQSAIKNTRLINKRCLCPRELPGVHSRYCSTDNVQPVLKLSIDLHPAIWKNDDLGWKKAPTCQQTENPQRDRSRDAKSHLHRRSVYQGREAALPKEVYSPFLDVRKRASQGKAKQGRSGSPFAFVHRRTNHACGCPEDQYISRLRR